MTAAVPATRPAGVEWYNETPHLKLRLNHVLKLHVPDIPEWKYVQVIGGGGLCEVGITVVGSWAEVQREDHLNKTPKECLYMFVSNFDFNTSISTWDWIERHRLPVAERAVQGPAGDVAADEEDLEKVVTPKFCRARLYKDGKGLKRHPTMQEYAYLHLAARACTQMLREQRLVSHGAGTGDAAKYSPFQFRVEVPVSERMPLPGGWSDADVALTFPAEGDPDKMSYFQRRSVKGLQGKKEYYWWTNPMSGRRYWNKCPESDDEKESTEAEGEGEEEMSMESRVKMHKCLTIKGKGNDKYKEGEFEAALELYQEALDTFPHAQTEAEKKRAAKDVGFISAFQNLVSNSAHALLKLQRFEEVVKATTRLVGRHMTHQDSVYQVRCLWARAQAYEGLRQYENAHQDVNLLLRQARQDQSKGLKLEVPMRPMQDAIARLQTTMEGVEGSVRWTRLLAPGGAGSTKTGGQHTIPPRFFHAAAVDGSTSTLYVHGGTYQPQDGDDGRQCQRWDVWRLHLQRDPGEEPHLWEDVECLGVPPPALEGHSAVIYNGVMTVFGGNNLMRISREGYSSPNRECYCWELHLATREWREGPMTGAPSARKHHTAVLYGGKMWVYGGQLVRLPGCQHPVDDGEGAESNCSVARSEVWSLTLATGEWQCESAGCADWEMTAEEDGREETRWQTEGDADEDHAADAMVGGEESEAKAGEEGPMAREHHICWVHGHKMIVFGGHRGLDFSRPIPYTRGEGYLADLWEYTFKDGTWRRLSTGGMVPGPRSETCAAIFRGRAVYIWGGYAEVTGGSKYFADGLRLIHHTNQKPAWYHMHAGAGSPSARAGCTLTVHEESKQAVLVGGYNGMEDNGPSVGVKGDTWFLTLSKHKEPSTASQQPCAHCGDVKSSWSLTMLFADEFLEESIT
ncbi:hypothetical protein CYMTET_50444 [Cymbomonas tetramitiformis]|uniref:Uncharacterized protein n=1 Tax=Cymbomonas tetramitiformis TaxID=36881 RepID=A0AAE0BP85_9CHLO|nr:hypothetical protein CYMTET_50444 [Cymbomonas tetramitiformis]